MDKGLWKSTNSRQDGTNPKCRYYNAWSRKRRKFVWKKMRKKSGDQEEEETTQ